MPIVMDVYWPTIPVESVRTTAVAEQAGFEQ